jgi:hypothetical protein
VFDGDLHVLLLHLRRICLHLLRAVIRGAVPFLRVLSIFNSASCLLLLLLELRQHLMCMLQLDLKLLHGDSSGVLVGFHLLDAEHALFFLLIEDLLRLLLLLRVSPSFIYTHKRVNP